MGDGSVKMDFSVRSENSPSLYIPLGSSRACSNDETIGNTLMKRALKFFEKLQGLVSLQTGVDSTRWD